MTEHYVVYAGPEVTQFTFRRDKTIVEVDGDGELYLWERIPGSSWQGDKHGELLGVFAREHWVAVTTLNIVEPPHLGPDLTAVKDDK